MDEEDKLTERIVLSGQRREVVLINESGLYPELFTIIQELLVIS